jgi:hypothetical protein
MQAAAAADPASCCAQTNTCGMHVTSCAKLRVLVCVTQRRRHAHSRSFVFQEQGVQLRRGGYFTETRPGCACLNCYNNSMQEAGARLPKENSDKTSEDVAAAENCAGNSSAAISSTDSIVMSERGRRVTAKWSW